MTDTKNALEWIDEQIRVSKERGIDRVLVYETIRTALLEVDGLWGRIAFLEERLELNHAYKMVDGELQRYELKKDETIPDGIYCRDATIKLQDEVIDRLKAELAALKQPAKRCEAVGNEHCWLHDRAGKECHENMGDAVTREDTVRVELAQTSPANIDDAELNEAIGWLKLRRIIYEDKHLPHLVRYIDIILEMITPKEPIK